MVTKIFDIALDLKRSLSNREFELVEGDTGNIFHITLTDGGEAVNLDGCKVVAVFAKTGGTTSQASGVEGNGVSVDGNEITIELRKESYGVGTTECELQVYSGELQDMLVTTARFNFSARKAFFNEETAQATNEYPILVQLIADANEAAQNATDAAALVEESASKATQAVTDAEAAVEAAENLSEEVTAAEAIRNQKVDEVYAAYNSGALKGAKGDKGDKGDAGKVQSVDNVQPNADGTLTLSAVRYASQTLTADQQAQARSNVNAAGLDANGKVEAEQAQSRIKFIESDYTLSIDDAGCFLMLRSSEPITITIPENNSVAFPIGTEIELYRATTYDMTIQASPSVHLRFIGGGEALGQSCVISEHYGAVCIKKLFADFWIASGAIA